MKRGNCQDTKMKKMITALVISTLEIIIIKTDKKAIDMEMIEETLEI